MTRWLFIVSLGLQGGCATATVTCEHAKIYPGYETHRCAVTVDGAF